MGCARARQSRCTSFWIRRHKTARPILLLSEGTRFRVRSRVGFLGHERTGLSHLFSEGTRCGAAFARGFGFLGHERTEQTGLFSEGTGCSALFPRGRTPIGSVCAQGEQRVVRCSSARASKGSARVRAAANGSSSLTGGSESFAVAHADAEWLGVRFGWQRIVRCRSRVAANRSLSLTRTPSGSAFVSGGSEWFAVAHGWQRVVRCRSRTSTDPEGSRKEGP